MIMMMMRVVVVLLIMMMGCISYDGDGFIMN